MGFKLSDANPELLDRLGDLSNSQLRILAETYNVDVPKRATKDELIHGICERGHLSQQQNSRLLGNLLDQETDDEQVDADSEPQTTSAPGGCVVLIIGLGALVELIRWLT